MSTGWRKGFADVVAAIRGTLADASNAGSMTAAEFLKLAGLPTSAVPTARTIGTTAPLTGGGDLSADRTLAISAASGAAAGSMSAADFSKLAGLPSSAVPTTRTIGTTAPLTGGGDLSADRTLAISAASGAGAGSMSAADFSKLALYPGTPRLTGATALMGMWESALIDLAAAPAVYAGIIPAAPAGLIFVPNKVNVVIVSKAGTLSTQPTVRVGNDATNSNFLAAANFPNTTAINLGAGGSQQLTSPNAAIAYTQNATNLEVTVAATGTGGFALTARFQVVGTFMDFT